MFFEQLVRQDIGCASYLVGSTDAGEAAVIDPRIDMVDDILAMAAQEGLRIRYILETHNHADHVSGHHQLAARTGATIAVHADAGASYPHLALHDGDELTLGEVRLRVLHTPGHRPEHIAVAAIDTSRSDEPWLVLTGDSLFIGDVARPDLAVDGREGAEALFHSLHQQLLDLPDGTLVYPGHVSGSLCGRVNNRMTGTTIGFERRFNPALAIDSEREFTRYMNESLPQRPPNMGRIVELNRSAAALEAPESLALDASEYERLRNDGATLLDVRSHAEFAAGHIPGAISVDLHGSQFQNRAGLVLPIDARIVLVASSPEQAREVVTALSVIGFTDIAGYVLAGTEQAAHDTATIERMSVGELRERMQTANAIQVFDVREPNEWQEGHIPGVPNVPFYRIREAASTLDPQQPVALICGSGKRSMIAASLLEGQGVRQVINVEGGMEAWQSMGFPDVRGEQVAATTA